MSERNHANSKSNATKEGVVRKTTGEKTTDSGATAAVITTENVAPRTQEEMSARLVELTYRSLLRQANEMHDYSVDNSVAALNAAIAVERERVEIIGKMSQISPPDMKQVNLAAVRRVLQFALESGECTLTDIAQKILNEVGLGLLAERLGSYLDPAYHSEIAGCWWTNSGRENAQYVIEGLAYLCSDPTKKNQAEPAQPETAVQP